MKTISKLLFLSITLLVFNQNATAQTNSVPAFSHIVVVIGENTNASAVFGNANAPYINALAAQGAKFTNSFGLFHPSQPNYLGLFSGSNQGVTGDATIRTKFTTPNLARELIDAGKSYATYSEGLPAVGSDVASSGKYARKHNPGANWMGTGTNRIPATTNQPFTAFPTNFNNLPSVSFVVPDLCNDGHDTCSPLNNSTLQYDRWIQTNLDAYKNWCINNNSLLIVTYDEDDFTSTNKIATVFYGANVKQGVYAQTIKHYNVLRTIEDAFRLTTHAGAAATATSITYCWKMPVTAKQNDSEKTLVNEAESTTGLRLYPNPVNDNDLFVSGIDNAVGYEIFEGTGKKIQKGKIENGSISVGLIPQGVYFIRFDLPSGEVVKTFVKK